MPLGLLRSRHLILVSFLAFLLAPIAGWPQATAPAAIAPAEGAASPTEMLAASLRELQAQILELKTALLEVRAEAAGARTETEALRRELQATRAQIPSPVGSNGSPAGASSAEGEQPQSLEQRVAKLEEDQQISEAKSTEQYQTKVESASKYRVRLSGIALLNLFSNRGIVENLDFPTWAAAPGTLDSARTFGGTVRQSELGLEVFGPELAGAKTSGSVQVDFAGGLTQIPNGETLGVLRLRTAVMRLDWRRTSIVAGQDDLFFAPLHPSSLASLAVPPLAYSGDLWAWTPQVRVEHRLISSPTDSLVVQGGILDGLTGDFPTQQFARTPEEEAGQPAYATHIAWNHRAFGRTLTLGAGGYYSRQHWGFGRFVDAWAATSEWILPVSRWLEVSGEFYRGRAVGGLNGIFGTSIVWFGDLTDPHTVVRGLNAAGGWTQIKLIPAERFEINGAFGLDNPFARDVPGDPASLWRNRSGFVNFIYRPRSNLLLSAEYRHLRTTTFAGTISSADLVDLSMGILF